MWRPRIIPVLLLKEEVLVKSIGFAKHRYIGDPLNAVRLFNDLQADELIFLDITASAQNRCISAEIVGRIGEEAKMPFGVGGGFRNITQVQQVISAGAEKVIIGSEALLRPSFVAEIAGAFGSSSVAVCMDIKRRFLGSTYCWINNGKKRTAYHPVAAALEMERQGAGEIIVQSVERDGSMQGYDIGLLKEVSDAVSIPVVALGGAGKMEHLTEAFEDGMASALAAGSMFVYQGSRRGVLINYPTGKIVM